MSKRHDRITRKLREIGACWAVRSDKFCWANDPLEDQIAGRKTYHIHPNAAYPHQANTLRFYSLREVEEYIRARKAADAAEDGAAAWEIMADFWAGLSL